MIKFKTKLIALLLYFFYILRFYCLKKKSLKLHIGCGNNYFDGWINADLSPKADLIIFLEKRLPFKKEFLEIIYSEHVLEHVSYKTGLFFLKESYRTLKKRGVLRVAMPDLEDCVRAYWDNDWKSRDWVKLYPIQTKAQMLNMAFREWGHQHLYDKEELERALIEAGFKRYKFFKNGESDYENLANLETREDSKLIVEAIKD